MQRFVRTFALSEGETSVRKNLLNLSLKKSTPERRGLKRGKKEGERMKSVLNDFANDTDADLAAYVQMYRTRIADRTDEIEVMMRGPIDEVMRDAIARLKWEQGEERERLEQIKDEQKRRTATSKGVSLEC
jgi:hypothetical protein